MATGSRRARANSAWRGAGFKTAVTTRPGMIFPESADHMTALQRFRSTAITRMRASSRC
jgi:hypothetical protein